MMMKKYLLALLLLTFLGCARSVISESKDLICPSNNLVTVSPMGPDSISLTHNEQTYTLIKQAIDRGKKFSGSGYRLYLLENKYYLAFPGSKKARFCRD